MSICSSLIFLVHLKDVRPTSGTPMLMMGKESPRSAQLGLCVCSQEPLNTQLCYVVCPQLQCLTGTTVSPGPHMSEATCLFSWVWYVGPGGGRGHSPSLGMCEIQAKEGVVWDSHAVGMGPCPSCPGGAVVGKQAQSAFVSSPRVSKMHFVRTKLF